MSDLSFKKIEQSIKDRKKLHLSFLDNVKTYKPFLELEEKAFSDGALKKKTKRVYNHFLHLTGVPLRSTPAGEKYVIPPHIEPFYINVVDSRNNKMLRFGLFGCECGIE